jgi:hypothetical protein
LNVQHYFAAVGDGMFALMVSLGLAPDEIRRRQISFAVVRAETDFHRELRSGDVIALESTILTLGEKSASRGWQKAAWQGGKPDKLPLRACSSHSHARMKSALGAYRHRKEMPMTCET